MSLDKAIEHGKEHRKPYYGAKAVDSTCRNHGSCPHCKANRLHKKQPKEELSELINEAVVEVCEEDTVDEQVSEIPEDDSNL